MEIRHLADRRDIPGLVESHGRAWRVAYDGIVPDAVLAGMTVDPTPDEIDRWHDRFAVDHDRILVAVLDGTVRGYAFVRWGEDTKPFVGPDEAGLKAIYVHPDHWGGGIGTTLLERGLALLPSTVTSIKLEMLDGNDVGAGFYESRGFERIGTGETDMAGGTLPTADLRARPP